ncbi:MAG: DUF945 family protein, partial [Steroidobacteraceae bacterium]
TSNIQHGPLPGMHAPALAIVDSTLVVPPALQKEFSAILGSKPVLEVHTTFGFFGGASANLASPACSLRLPGGSSLAWGGLTGTVTAARNQARWSAQLSAPRVALQSVQGGIELTGMEYTGAHEKALGDLYVGTGNLTIEGVDGRTPRGNYSLQRISLTSTAKATGEFFDIRVDVATDAAEIASLSLKNVTYSESFEHVHGPSLASMVQAIRVAEHQSGLDRTQLQTGMRDAVRQYGGDLLLHDPVIDIRQVGFTMPEGSLLFSAKLSAPGLSRADLQWPAAIGALKTHAQIGADLRVDNGLVRRLLAMGGSNPRIAAQVAALEQKGYLTAGASNVTTHLEFSGGRLTLNGRAFPPAAPMN